MKVSCLRHTVASGFMMSLMGTGISSASEVLAVALQQAIRVLPEAS